MSEKHEASNQAPEQAGPVDIDELEVQVLILAQKAQAMNQTGSFLSRRGWPTTVLSNIAEAIKHIVKEQPDFVLISMNHQSPKALKLPALLTKTLNIQCVGFAEKTDALTLERLSRSQFTHKIGGFASGPSVQRAIRKILNDIYNPSESADGQEGRADEKLTSEAIRVSGSTDGSFSSEGKSSQVVKGAKETKEANRNEYDTVSSEKYTMHSQKIRRRLKDLNSLANPAAQSHHISSPTEASQADSDSQAQELLKLLGEDPGPENTSEQLASTPKKQSPPQKPENRATSTAVTPSWLRSPSESEDLLSQIVQTALDRVFGKDGQATTEGDFSSIDSLGVLPMEGFGMQGYLLVAKSTKPHEVSMDFLEELRDVIIQNLLAQDLVADISSPFAFTVKPLAFEQWLTEKSPFTLNSQLHNSLVQVGFIPRSRTAPKLVTGPDRNMVFFPAESLSPEQAVNFKAYLYLKKNNKYFLYLKEGRHIQERQLQNLAERKINNLLINADDTDRLREYAAKADLSAQTQTLQAPDNSLLSGKKKVAA